MNAVTKACAHARATALKSGLPVTYRDVTGRYVEERPDGRRFEIRYNETRPRQSHTVMLRELKPSAA